MKSEQPRYTVPEFKKIFRLTPQKKAGKRRDYPGELLQQLQLAGLPLPVREVRFDAKRRWRFDLAYEEICLAIEIEGILYASAGQSRHQTVAGYSKDCEKYNAATLAGFRIFRFTQKMVVNGDALRMIEKALTVFAG